jgi:hypothetical protein
LKVFYLCARVCSDSFFFQTWYLIAVTETHIQLTVNLSNLGIFVREKQISCVPEVGEGRIDFKWRLC